MLFRNIALSLLWANAMAWPSLFPNHSGTVRSATWENMICFKLLIFSLKANLRVLLCSPELFYFLFNGLTSIYCRSLVQLLMWHFLNDTFAVLQKQFFYAFYQAGENGGKGSVLVLLSLSIFHHPFLFFIKINVSG